MKDRGHALKFGATDLMLAAGAVAARLGVGFFFPVCAVGDMVMSCHWAGEVLKALFTLDIVLAALHLVVPDGMVKTGMDLSIAGISVVTLLVPGTVVRICQDPSMACRKTLIGAVAFSVILILLAAADALASMSREAKEKHSRGRNGEAL